MADKKKEKPRHLGRGLQALLGPIIPAVVEVPQVSADTTMEPNFPPDNDLRDSLRELSVDAITPSSRQ